MSGSILVIDVGTSGLRAAIVEPTGLVSTVHHRRFPPEIPFAGLLEIDAIGLAAAVLDVANATLAASGPVAAVGIANQRASTIVWDRATGVPVANGLGWQDLRTVGECLMAKAEHGLGLAPNQSATKVAWLLAQHDPDRTRDLCFGTIDTWVIWQLTGGALHVTDRSNAAVTGLLRTDGTDWDDRVLDALKIPRSMLPSLVDSTGVVGLATALPGAPLIAGIAGDQQASLIGQGCVRPGMAKITFGTGGMLDMCTGSSSGGRTGRSGRGTFPIVAWTEARQITWGTEAIMLSAGTNVDWLVEDLGVLANAAESHVVASQVTSSDGVVYVPAQMGLGTPHWDYGARGTLLGLTRGSTRAHIVRAVLEGVAHRGVDLIEAAEADAELTIPTLRVDGGMSANPTFIQALANASGKPVEVSPVLEATTLGAGFLAGIAVGTWSSLAEAAGTWAPSHVVEPKTALNRAEWCEAIQRSERWIPELSALDF
jgi:glycerol kinase